MSDKVRGYNITLKLGGTGGLLVAGITNAGYKVTPEYEETLIKENAGVKQYERIDAERTISMTALMMIKTSGESATHYDFTQLRAAADAGTVLDFSYGWHSSGKPIVTGDVRITSYSEDTGPNGLPEVQLELAVVGTPTYTTGS